MSSSWRWDEQALRAVKANLKKVGLKLSDTTIQDIRVNLNRTQEIQLYLDEHPNVTNFVILDDDKINEPLSSYWIRCLFKNGLTRELANQAINILEGKNG